MSAEDPLASFRVPKKKNTADIAATSQQTGLIPQEVLSNSYYNDAYVGRPGYANPCPQFPTQNHVPSQEEIALKIHHVLKTYKEKPKQFDPKNILRQTIPDVEDESLPKELTEMFQPLFCKLCPMQLTSNSMARLHYKSKNHEKKIRKYLVEYSERTGERLHRRACVGTKKPKEDDERYRHCFVCDLPLTGKLHAESHYMGKNHQKALLGYKPPAGKGRFDADGKWVREKPQPKVILKEGEDTFGLAFRRAEQQKQAPAPTAVSPASASTTCALCGITTTTPEQMQAHYNGQKHQKKLKRLEMPDFVPQNNVATAAASGSVKEDTNVSFCANRTPSGHYYCKVCDMTVNSETQFKQHIQSKGHLKRHTTC